MPYIAGTLQPTGVGYLACPRCWASGPFVLYASLTTRCSRCEWPFTISASTALSPAVPASTVTYTNTSGSPLACTITGGTLTYVYVNAVQAGTTAATYYVPVAGTISITYSAAPTWAFALITTSGALSAGGTAITITSPTGANVVFSYGQVLVIDPSGTPDIVTVNGTPTATSIPCTALSSGHGSGKNITVAQLTPALSGSGLENVPQNSY